MGAKTWMLVYAEENASNALAALGPLDREASAELAARLFPGEKFEALPDGDLSYTNPPDEEVFVGCFPGVSVVAAIDFAVDNPSQLPELYLTPGANGNVYLHAMHSVVDWFAFAVWQRGQLQRALSLAPDNGIIEDIGTRLAFEEPYWAGQHPVDDPEEELEEEERYPFVFHPLELGEAALKEFFGYQLEGFIDPALLSPEKVPLLRFKRVA
jgi:hypothetical protein